MGIFFITLAHYYCLIHLQEKYVALGLVDGKVTFQANPEDLLFNIKTDKEYNDGKWHFVAVNKNGAMYVLFCKNKKLISFHGEVK